MLDNQSPTKNEILMKIEKVLQNESQSAQKLKNAKAHKLKNAITFYTVNARSKCQSVMSSLVDQKIVQAYTETEPALVQLVQYECFLKEVELFDGRAVFCLKAAQGSLTQVIGMLSHSGVSNGVLEYIMLRDKTMVSLAQLEEHLRGRLSK